MDRIFSLSLSFLCVLFRFYTIPYRIVCTSCTMYMLSQRNCHLFTLHTFVRKWLNRWNKNKNSDVIVQKPLEPTLIFWSLLRLVPTWPLSAITNTYNLLIMICGLNSWTTVTATNIYNEIDKNNDFLPFSIFCVYFSWKRHFLGYSSSKDNHIFRLLSCILESSTPWLISIKCVR